MRASAIDRYKTSLTKREMPDPQPGPGQVLVAIAATSVNPIDFKLRDGEFKAVLPMAMPLILGGDLAGTVVALGQARRGSGSAMRCLHVRTRSAPLPSGSWSRRPIWRSSQPAWA